MESIEAKVRKEKINKLLNICGFDLHWNEKMIDIFDDVSITINIKQRLEEQILEEYNYVNEEIDSVVLDIKVEDFEDVDLEDEDATDMVKEMFDDIVKERLSGKLT